MSVSGREAAFLLRKASSLFKLLRLWGLRIFGETFALREIPPGRHDFSVIFDGGIKVVALFDKSVKYRLIEAYGLNCHIETDERLRFEMDFSNREYNGFSAKVKVLEPPDIAEELQAAETDMEIFSSDFDEVRLPVKKEEQTKPA